MIIANVSEEEKNAPPFRTETVYFPALIRSASISFSGGYGPSPSIPFSDCRNMSRFGSIKLTQRDGIPMPRFTFIPYFIS